MVLHIWDSFQEPSDFASISTSSKGNQLKTHACSGSGFYHSAYSSKFRTIILWLIFTCALPYYILGVDLHLNDKDVMQFADFLYQNKEYYRAVSEYKRHQHFFPSSPLFQKASLQVGRAFMAGGEYQEAIQYWRLSLKEPDQDDETFNRIKILLGLSLLDVDKDRPFQLRKRYIDDAFQEFAGVKDVDHESRLIIDFLDDWKERPPPDYGSPWIAGLMSAAVPGSGSFYSGRFMEGTYAFFLTVLFGIAAHNAVQNDHQELAVVFGFFTLTFYGGGIYTAVNSVHKTNDKMDSDELYRLRKKHGIWFIPEANNNKGRF